MSTEAIEEEAKKYLEELHIEPGTMIQKNYNLERLGSMEAGSYHMIKDLMAGFYLRMKKKLS